ncbi:MAG: ABC transporter permease [Herbaspirillum sp.]|uniref:ABC transporter permease n=1 Tax=Herbaspirillum sp. TaxID=1890675 RepID=UPI00258F00C5|nr:ABC transporter permease [Herbaspirillum sp.]MCP4557383.1 ABC transporter permease [Herbaspirillum sp.]
METLRHDLILACRSLGKRPGFTGAIIGALALGIGAAIAVFSVIDAAVLRPLPFPDPDQLVVLSMVDPGPGGGHGWVSVPDFLDWKKQSRSFAHLALVSNGAFVLTGVDYPQRLSGASVSAEFFALFGVSPIRGGIPADAWAADQRGVILSHHAWRSRFGAAEGIVGRKLTLDDQPYTVLAVMPPEFDFPKGVEVWVPFDPKAHAVRVARIMNGLGRLREDIALEQAQNEMNLITRQLAVAHPNTNEGTAVNLVPLHQHLVADLDTALGILLGAVVFVLLIVCANVTSLLLARATARIQEMQIRAALGATRRRLVFLLVVESLLLAAAGGAIGLPLGLAGSRLFVALYPETIHGTERLGVDGTVIGFCVLLVLGTGLVAGLMPAFQGTKKALAGSLREGAVHLTASAATRRTQAVVLVAQIAVTLVLLFGAGLMLNSLFRLFLVDPGFRPDGLLTARITLPKNRYPESPQQAAFFAALLERLNAHPNVSSAAAVTNLPLSGTNMLFGFVFENRTSTGGSQALHAEYRAVSPRYFRTMGVELLEGRDFTVDGEPVARPVAIVNQAFARRFYADDRAIGERIEIFYGDRQPREIIGVVADMKHFDLGKDTQPEIYVPYTQQPWAFMALILRTSGDPMNMVSVIRSEVAALDKDQPLYRVQSMTDAVSGSIAQPQFYSALLGTFALIALLTAAIGVYGLTAYWASLRAPEVGVRMAMGATPADVLSLFVRQQLKLTVIGFAIGAVAALALARLLAGWLYGITAADPATFFGMASLLGVTSLFASYLPARHSAAQDPASVLRTE